MRLCSATAISRAPRPLRLLASIKGSLLPGQVSTQSRISIHRLTFKGYYKTNEAKAAGGEVLGDLNGGNSHRLRVRNELREGGITSLQDSYVDSNFRRVPPPGRPGRGAAADIANDRGHFSHSRGGGFAGRGLGRGTARGMARGSARTNAPVSR